MSELITLSKSSPDFERYLLGTFSAKKRALPVQTLNVNSASETVTFRIVDIEEVEKPSWVMELVRTYKVRSFFLILLPLLLILTKNVEDGTHVDPLVLLCSTIGVIMAFLAVNLRNDFMDHMKGIDRVLETSGSRAIQNGWTTAFAVRRASSIYLGLALFFATVLSVLSPDLIYIFIASLAVGLWAQFKKRNSFKYQIGGEFAIFLMLGPLLTVGYQIALAGYFDWESFWIGCLWGWAVLFVVHLRNFMNILPSVQAGFSNTVNWMGFDRTRRLLAIWWGLLIIFHGIFHYFFAGTFWGYFSTIALALCSLSFIFKLKGLSSPIGSELKTVFRNGFYLFLLAVGVWVSECLWYLLT